MKSKLTFPVFYEILQ